MSDQPSHENSNSYVKFFKWKIEQKVNSFLFIFHRKLFMVDKISRKKRLIDFPTIETPILPSPYQVQICNNVVLVIQEHPHIISFY